MIIADTSGLLALYNSKEPTHHAVAKAVAATSDVLVVSPFVIAELDYLVATRLGVDTELRVLAELSSGAYELAALSAVEIHAAMALIDRYRKLEIGVTDASMVVLAERYRTRTILTLDWRHFSTIRPLDGGRFKLVPN